MAKGLLNWLSPSTSSNRVYGLDILRAAAILFVVIGHSGHLLKPLIKPKFLNYFVLDGVSIFFVLSGFLIGGILLKTVEKDGQSLPVLIHFWVRRWFRTLPNYFLVLILILVTKSILGDFPKVAGHYFLFLQNFAWPHPHFFPEAWSLSVEEWFYLIFPLILFGVMNLLKTPLHKSIFWVAISFIILSVAFRWYRFEAMDFSSNMIWDRWLRKQVLTRMDSLMFGVIGAYFSLYFTEIWTRYKKLCLPFGIIILFANKYAMHFRRDLGLDLNLYYCVFYFSSIAIGTLLLLPYLSELKAGKGRVYKGSTIISLISYSMYLIHFTLVQRFALPATFKLIPIESEFTRSLLTYLLYWVFTIVGSLLLYKYFEVPMMRLRQKFPLTRIQRIWSQ